LAYKGPYPHSNGGVTTGLVVSATTFGSAVINTGTISPNGIVVQSHAFISGGGIIDSGGTAVISGGIKVDSSSKIVASGGSTLTAIDIISATRFAGGISNAGVLSAAHSGILVSAVTTFAGGIVNNGTIVASLFGVRVDGGGLISGGIRVAGNGKISAASGIVVENTTTFVGGISNAGTISAALSGIAVKNTATFAGGISDTGAISGSRRGILISGGDVVSGGIRVATSGRVVATFGSNTGVAVEVANATSFAGGISNAGTLQAAQSGLVVSGVTTFAGNIVNSGSVIDQSGLGIAVEDVAVFGNTGAGGITNAGKIRAPAA
jgi:filamentous hemagglutinin